MRDLGWDATLTRATGDGGCDVLAGCGPERLVVQCKDWRQPVGVSAVREVHAARTRFKADHAVVVASGRFLASARDEAAALDVNLLTLADLSAGSRLDRSEQGRRIREAEAAARRKIREDADAAAWDAYDDALQRYAKATPFRTAGWVALGIAAAACAWVTLVLWREHTGWSVFAAFVAWAVLPNLAGALWSAKPPTAPTTTRPSKRS